MRDFVSKIWYNVDIKFVKFFCNRLASCISIFSTIRCLGNVSLLHFFLPIISFIIFQVFRIWFSNNLLLPLFYLHVGLYQIQQNIFLMGNAPWHTKNYAKIPIWHHYQLPCTNRLYQGQQNIFLMGNTPMEQRALFQNTNMILFLNWMTIYLFQTSQWIKKWIMQSKFSLVLYLFLKRHSSTLFPFFTYFANQLPGFCIGGKFGLRFRKNSDSFWKYCISLKKCPLIL